MAPRPLVATRSLKTVCPPMPASPHPSPLTSLHLHSSHPRNVITNQLLTKNAVNIYYASGDIAWVITATALVLLMIPGVG